MMENLVIAFMVGGVLLIAEAAVSEWRWHRVQKPEGVKKEEIARFVIGFGLILFGFIIGLIEF